MVGFYQGAQLLYRCSVGTIDHLNGVWVPHGHHADVATVAGDVQRIGDGFAFGDKGNVYRTEAWHAHIDHSLILAKVFRNDHALGGFNPNGLFIGQFLVANKFGETACAIAALFYFAAIVIENTVTEIVVFCAGGFHQQELVEADAEVAVAELADSVGIQ